VTDPAPSLFVYGTLMSGHSRAGMVPTSARQPAKTRGRLFRLPAGYPALVTGGEAWVYGEIVEIDDARLLALLDHYEGTDEGLFRRVRLPVVLGLRSQVAWTYVMDHPERLGGVPIESGRWRPLRAR